MNIFFKKISKENILLLLFLFISPLLKADTFHFTQIAVTKGHATYIEIKNDNGNTIYDIIVDGGSMSSNQILKDFMSDKSLDAVFVTHYDEDHIGGLVGNNKNGLLHDLRYANTIIYDRGNVEEPSTHVYDRYKQLNNRQAF